MSPFLSALMAKYSPVLRYCDKITFPNCKSIKREVSSRSNCKQQSQNLHVHDPKRSTAGSYQGSCPWIVSVVAIHKHYRDTAIAEHSVAAVDCSGSVGVAADRHDASAYSDDDVMVPSRGVEVNIVMMMSQLVAGTAVAFPARTGHLEYSSFRMY